MKITFVRPNIGRLEHSLYVDEGRMEPLGLGVLAGLTPRGVDCVLYDDRIEVVPFDERTDLAAITVETYTARRAFEIAAEYRVRGVPVVMGGFHATLAPDECLGHADAICVGDAERVWPEIVEDARRGQLRRRYRAPPPGTPQGGGVLPRRDLFEGKGYLPISLMQYSRGCRFACDFCAISTFFGRTWQARPGDEVLREIERQERKLVFFVDDNFLADHEAAKRFLRRLVPLRIRWVSQGTVDMTRDPELMDLLVESGCLGNVIGFESLDPRNLAAMNKKPNLPATGWDSYEDACRVLRDHHLQTWAAFTLGHDHDTPESIRVTFDFAMEQKFCFAAFNILMPYPGTPLYARLARQGRLLWNGRWWLHPDYRFNHAAFRPALMSPEALTEACWDCRQRWNRRAAIFKRIWDPKTHLSSPLRLGLYLRYNPLYAREAVRKQGMRFGAAEPGVDVERHR